MVQQLANLQMNFQQKVAALGGALAVILLFRHPYRLFRESCNILPYIQY